MDKGITATIRCAPKIQVYLIGEGKNGWKNLNFSNRFINSYLSVSCTIA